MVATPSGTKPVQKAAATSSDNEEKTFEQLDLIAISKGKSGKLARKLLTDRETARHAASEAQKHHQHGAMLESTERVQVEGAKTNKVSAEGGGMCDYFNL